MVKCGRAPVLRAGIEAHIGGRNVWTPPVSLSLTGAQSRTEERRLARIKGVVHSAVLEEKLN
jgi:hypothetical protein